MDESNIKNDLIYIKKNTPKDLNFILFLFFFPISFFYFFFVLIFCIFGFFFYTFNYLFITFFKKEGVILINYKNNFNNSFLYFCKEFFINYPKAKSYLTFYVFLKNLKTKEKIKKNYDVLIFNYIFKRLFKLVTLIPFTIFKINCTIFKRYKNATNWNLPNKNFFKAFLDNILLNLYLEDISDQIIFSQECRIIITKGNIKFNPPKFDLYNFKGVSDYLAKKKVFEKISEYAVLKNNKENSPFIKRHLCKLYDVFKNTPDNLKKYVAFTETKSNSLLNNKNKLIENKLKDVGTKNPSIKTYKAGVFITEKNSQTIDTLSGNDIKALIEGKNKFSWKFLIDAFYNNNTLYLGENNYIFKNEGETLKTFFLRNYQYLNDDAKEFLDVKEKFDNDNSDLIKSMLNQEYIESLEIDFYRWQKEKLNFDLNSKKKKDIFEDQNDDNF